MEISVLILLVTLGLIGIILEPFVPAGGLLAVAGVIVMLVGVGIAYHSHGAVTGTLFLLACIILGPGAAIAGFKIFPYTPMGKRLIMKQTLQTEDGFQSSDSSLLELEGQEGVTLTMLRPSGTARFGTRRVDVVTEGELVDQKEPVRVIHVAGNRVVVEKVDYDG